jgi:phosphatidylglycerophosphate synthase
VILLVGLIGMGAAPALQWAALCIAAVGSALDGVDGWAARRTQMSSAYGARFDMETDALLILVLTVLAWQFGKVGLWVLASGLMRYVFVAASLLFVWLRRPLPASRRRKTAAVVQTISLLVAVAPFVPPNISGSLCAGALAVLAWSFLLDIAWLRRHAPDAQAAS